MAIPESPSTELKLLQRKSLIEDERLPLTFEGGFCGTEGYKRDTHGYTNEKFTVTRFSNHHLSLEFQLEQI